MITYSSHPTEKQLWSRSSLIEIINSALEIGEYRFAKQTSMAWLASFPGDLRVRLLQSKALIGEGLGRQAISILKYLVNVDPENIEAQSLLTELREEYFGTGSDDSKGNVKVLRSDEYENEPKGNPSVGWHKSLAKIRNLLLKGDTPNAAASIQDVLATASDISLTGVTHLQILRAQENIQNQAIQNLAELYHQRWPECIQFMIILAESLLASGESEKAVALLHKAATRDVIGQVATRIWGDDHAYKNLWPQKLEAAIPIQIPSNIALHLGWNLLPNPKIEAPIDKQTTIVETEKSNKVRTRTHRINPEPQGKTNLEFSPIIHEQKSTVQENLILKKPEPEKIGSISKKSYQRRSKTSHKGQSNGRFPVYVIFSSQKGLRNKYGEKTLSILDRSMRRVVRAIRSRMDWGATLIYADEPSSMAQYGLKPVPGGDPWQLKLALADLDQALGKRGAKIGAVLIVGGPDVVPFHNLPNPTDDSDTHVPSDNPYATSDANYFIPEWPVGRLPGGTGKDPGVLLSVLRVIAETHMGEKEKPKRGIFSMLRRILGSIFTRHSFPFNSFGYTAEAWQKASSSVFKPIGDPRSMITSPPVEINQKQPIPIASLGYFNLHGVADSPEWFGQKDPRNNSNDPDFPTALHPKDVRNSGRSPKVIFSEACYGSHIQKKSVEDALALKFLASGTQAMVGSTVISYGSISTPLNAADLLGKIFWGYINEGIPAGESLHRAKIFLASEMHRRQGYLDGEDQKTLISFVLYGDPLAQEKNIKNWKSLKSTPFVPIPEEIITVCDRVDVPGTSEPIPKEIVENVRVFVEQYLPGMRDAQLSLSHEHVECFCKGHSCPTAQLGAKNIHHTSPERRVITLSKQIFHARKIHETYARMTFDNEGEIVKLAVSR